MIARLAHHFLVAVLLISISSISLSPIDGQVAVENGTFVKALVPLKYGLLAGLAALFTTPATFQALRLVPVGFWLFFSWVLFGTIWSINPIDSSARAVVFFMTAIIPITTVLTFGVERSLRAFWWFGFGLMLVSLAVSASGSDFGTMGGAHAELWRGVFVHKNHYGVFLAFFLLSTILGVGTPRSSLSWIAVALTAIQILRAGSATAFVLSAVGIAYGLFIMKLVTLHISAPLKAIFNFMVVLVAVIVSILLSPMILEILGRDATFSGRTRLWAAAWEFALDHPFGLGYRTGGGQDALDAIRISSGWLVAPSAHNGLLSLALDVGFVGLLLWLLWNVSLMFLPTRIADATRLRHLPVEAVAMVLMLNAQMDSSGGAYPSYPTAMLFLLIAARRVQLRSIAGRGCDLASSACPQAEIGQFPKQPKEQRNLQPSRQLPP